MRECVHAHAAYQSVGQLVSFLVVGGGGTVEEWVIVHKEIAPWKESASKRIEDRV